MAEYPVSETAESLVFIQTLKGLLSSIIVSTIGYWALIFGIWILCSLYIKRRGTKMGIDDLTIFKWQALVLLLWVFAPILFYFWTRKHHRGTSTNPVVDV